MIAIGERLPPTLLDTDDGKREPLAQPGRRSLIYALRGKWCPFCMTYLQDLTEARDRLAALGDVRLVSPSPLADMRAIGEWLKPPFRLLADPDFAVIGALGLRVPGGPGGRDTTRPALVIADADGVARFVHVGQHPLDRPSVDEVVDAFAGKTLESVGTLEKLRRSTVLVARGLKHKVAGDMPR
jgi:peroxiredoxin